MNTTHIQHIVMSYLNATGCQLLEVTPAYTTVKLSPEADKELTGRPYYWSFVERTGAPPETMTFTFVFDHSNGPSDGTMQSGSRVEHLNFGHARLQQIINAVRSRGQFVQLYEEIADNTGYRLHTTPYTSWLAVNYKLQFTCDMKREQLFSLGISLATGEIVEQYHTHLLTKKLTPKLPAHTHLRDTISLQRAKSELDKYIEHIIASSDHSWASAAHERMQVEIARMDMYYNELILNAEDDSKAEIEEQHTNRLTEIEWQYKPLIQAKPINCGIFHLLEDG